MKMRVALIAAAAATVSASVGMMTGCEPVVPTGSAVLVPSDYRSTFTKVRDCRSSIEHGFTIAVWVNEIGAAAYEANAETMPEGSVVIKEEFEGTACDDDNELAFWAVMVKREAGFDAESSDWQWQEVSVVDNEITADSGRTCLACHVEEACLERDLMCTVP